MFDTVLNNSSGIADVIGAINKQGTTATLATPGATAAPSTTAPATASATKATGWAGLPAALKAGIVAGGALLAFLAYRVLKRK